VKEARGTSWGVPNAPRIAVLPVDLPGRAVAPAELKVGGRLAELMGSEAAGELGRMFGDMFQSPDEAPRPGEAAALIEELLPFVLLRQGHSRFIGPEQLRGINAEKTAERGGTVTWRASLGRLMQVEPVSAVDIQLGLSVIGVELKPVDVSVGFTLDEVEVAAYAKQWEAFSGPAQREHFALQSARNQYVERYETAREAYEAKGGEYDGEKGPTPGDTAREAYRLTIAQLDNRIATLEEHLEKAPAPDELRKVTQKRTEKVSVPSAEVVLRARLVDADSLRVLWLAELRTRDATLELALNRVLERVVAELPGESAVGGAAEPEAEVKAKPAKKKAKAGGKK
jgi:hypothetical protein